MNHISNRIYIDLSIIDIHTTMVKIMHQCVTCGKKATNGCIACTTCARYTHGKAEGVGTLPTHLHPPPTHLHPPPKNSILVF